MPVVKDEAWKFLGSIVPMLGAGVQLWTGLVKDLRRSRYIEKAIGSLGRSYFWIWRVPLVLANVALGLIIILALLALFGGVNKLTEWCASPFCRLCELLFEQSLWLVVLYFGLAVMVYFQFWPKVLHLLGLGYAALIHPAARHSPGLINADWLLQRGEEARLINIDKAQCEIVASFLFKIPQEKSHSDYAGEKSLEPSWGPADRANALLIGCVIEGVIHDLPRSAPAKKELGALYSRIWALGAKNWEPNSIGGETAQNILNALGNAPAEVVADKRESGFFEKIVETFTHSHHEPAPSVALKSLADEEAIIQAVTDALQILSKKYHGDASKVASRKWRKPSLSRARKNLQAFPQMNGAKPNAMDTQFLKLAVSAQVWPTIKSGDFVYPFSRGVAALMMNTRCLVSTPDTKDVLMDDLFRRLLASAEQAVVNAVAVNVERNPDLAAKLGVSNPKDEWQISREVDSLLWWLSRRPRGWELNVEALDAKPTTTEEESESPSWKIAGNTLVRV